MSKGKNVNKLWQKLSHMSINSGLDLKTSFVREKKKCMTTSEISILVQCSLKCGVAFFFASDSVEETFDLRFMLFTKVLMKELARILIYIYKIFNGRMSFKILLLMRVATVGKKL